MQSKIKLCHFKSKGMKRKEGEGSGGCEEGDKYHYAPKYCKIYEIGSLHIKNTEH